MQIVIEIEYKDYEKMKDGHIPYNVLDVIMNGKILPKGHGRLIDADYIKEMKHEISASIYDICDEVVDVEDIGNAPTVIESDKEE